VAWGGAATVTRLAILERAGRHRRRPAERVGCWPSVLPW